jgi:hypothetical protein
MLRIVLVIFVIGGLFVVYQHDIHDPITVYMPDARQESQPLCISNRSTMHAVQIPNGPKLATGQSVTASVVTDFQWGFTLPAPSSDRADVDCVVIAD